MLKQRVSIHVYKMKPVSNLRHIENYLYLCANVTGTEQSINRNEKHNRDHIHKLDHAELGEKVEQSRRQQRETIQTPRVSEKYKLFNED